jgi:hypothetical protein
MKRRRGRDLGGKDVYFWAVWLIGGSHAQNYSLREASARLILALHEGAITGLPALLLDSKLRRGFFKRADVSLFSIPSILNAIGTAIKLPVEML